MAVPHDKVFALLQRFDTLHNKRKASLRGEIAAKREALRLPPEEVIAATDAALDVNAAQLSSWHNIWCVFANASICFPKTILQEHWKETEAMIERELQEQAEQQAANKKRKRRP